MLFVETAVIEYPANLMFVHTFLNETVFYSSHPHTEHALEWTPPVKPFRETLHQLQFVHAKRYPSRVGKHTAFVPQQNKTKMNTKYGGLFS